jgi:hypothetical protein
MSGAEPIIAAEAIGTAAAGTAAAEAAVAAEALAAAEAAAAAQAAATAAEAATAVEATSAAASASNVANPFFDPSQYANQFRQGLLQSSSGLPPAQASIGNLSGSLAPASFNPALIAPNVGKGAAGMSLMQGLQAARMAGAMQPKQQTTVGTQMRRGQPVNLMQPASLLDQKRKRNPIISLL